MKKTCFLFLLLCCGLALMAQDFEIVSVESLPFDMSAREEIYTDHNDRQCALLRIATQNIAPNQRELFNFVPDYGSEVVQRATRDGEIWLWVSPGLKYLRVKHRDWGQYELRLIDHVARVEALHTYKVTIKGMLTLPLQEQESKVPTQQYLAFRISPTNATLFVNDELWEVGSDGTAVRFVNFGTYNYRVMAPNYLPETGSVTVNDPDNTQTVPVSLKPDFVEVTLKVDADAEIWMNNEKKGTRTWTGPLGKGTYKIECKQEGHELSMISKEITTEMNGQTITLPAPTPIYGSLNVESTPIGATIYIDGKEVGKTPKSINEILIGQHEIKLTKDGYVEHSELVTIAKNKREQIKISLNAINNMSIVPQQLTTPSIVFDVSGSYNGHDYVDLGLPSGTLWATCNIGASSPENCGNYFAWGEVGAKAIYNWNTYKYCYGIQYHLTKYCNNGKDGRVDNLTELQSIDDAASVNWGNGWCMPNKSQWKELKDNTTCTWITKNGMSGMLFTAKNGKSVFLPASGYQLESNIYDTGSEGYYWSDSISTDSNSTHGQCFRFDSNYYYNTSMVTRINGLSVRPVRTTSQN